MAYTDHCDIYASFHEDAFNKIINHVREQRPSLFNYGTADLVKNQELLCKAIKVHPIVNIRSNPAVTLVDPLPVPGTNYGVQFAVQLDDLQIDFHPGNKFTLPPELKPLKPQHFAIKLTVCGGIGCPPEDYVNRLVPPPPPPVKTGAAAGVADVQEGAYTHAGAQFRDDLRTDLSVQHKKIKPLPFEKLNCFCLSAYVTGGIAIKYYYGKPYLEPFMEGFEIVDIKPEGLENSIECYVGLLMRLSVLPGLRFLLEHAAFNLTSGAEDLFPNPTNIQISPQPVSGSLPNNPAIEQDLLKAFLKVTVS